MIASYFDTRELRLRIAGLLSDAELRSTDQRDEFEALIAAARLGIVGLRRCSDSSVDWLRALLRPGLLEPSCIVVTPLSLAHIQRLRAVESSRFHVVWAEEVDQRLLDVVDQVDPWRRDPLRDLGRRMLCDCSFHGSMVKAIERICNLAEDDSPSDPPERSVGNLAREVRIAPDLFRRYWKEDVPLKCGPKQLLSWAMLMWALRQRSEARWEVIAGRAGVERRTLERHSTRLARCTLSTAWHDPQLVKRRFREWVAEVSEVDRPVDLASPPVQSRLENRMQRRSPGFDTPSGFAAVGEFWNSWNGSPRRWDTPLDFASQARLAGQ